MREEGIRGRFLPSRVYARWRWTVRSGLLLVPLVVFLAGGLLLYLSPNKYRSSSLVGVENGPPLPEIVALMTSEPVLERVVNDLDLRSRQDLDLGNLVSAIAQTTKIRVVPETRLLRITVSHTRKEIAQELADAIPRNLIGHLLETERQRQDVKSREIDQMISEAQDQAEEKAAKLVNFERLHGKEETGEPVTPVERARRASILADAEVERLRALRSESIIGLLDSMPFLLVHEHAKQPQTPYHPEIGKGLNEWVVRSLVVGLLAALLVPYLFELAFPPRAIARQDPADRPCPPMANERAENPPF